MATISLVALPVAGGLLGWSAAYVAMGEEALHTRPAEERVRRLWRAWVHACDGCSHNALVAALMRVQSWREASDALVDGLSWLRPLLGREQACAALLLANALVAVLLAVVARSPVGLVVAPLALGVGVPLWASSMRRQQAQQLAAEMPDVLRSLALALSSGQTLSQAIDYVGTHAHGQAAHAFSRVSMRMHCGDSTREALGALTTELDTPQVGLLVTALLISQRTGSPLKGLLETSAELAEHQGELERLLEVKTAQVRLSARVVCLLPLVLVGLLSLISVDFQAGLLTPAGALCVLFALCMDGLALFIVRRLMRGVL